MEVLADFTDVEWPILPTPMIHGLIRRTEDSYRLHPMLSNSRRTSRSDICVSVDFEVFIKCFHL